MATASKLSIFLTSPFPLLCSRPSLTRFSRVSIASFSSSSLSKRRFYLNSRRVRLGFSIKSSESNVHTQTTGVIKEDYHHPDSLKPSHNSRVDRPWPEWSKLVENLTSSGYFDRHRSFDELGDFSDEFKPAANACLSFAFDRYHLVGSLSREDIEVVVANGSPFLFNAAVGSERGIKSFLGRDRNSDLEQREGMVDLMRFILSYACHCPTASVDKYSNNRELVESSVRRLLGELSDASRKAQEVDLSGSMPNQFRDKYGQKPRPFRQNIEMKIGDWICSRCSFMNFAKNMKCLECDETRPKRLLTGGEWECPQCDFYNYGRNVVCLRCDCKCPSETPGPISGSGFTSEINQIRASQANDSFGLSKSINDGPEIMPLRKGVNRFVVSTKKNPLERSSTDDQYQSSFDNGTPAEGSGFQSEDVVGSRKTAESSINQSLDRILGRISSTPAKNDGKVAIEKNGSGAEKTTVSNLDSPSYWQSEGRSSNYVPFVPLPTDMFAKPQVPEKDKQVTYHNVNVVKADEQVASSLPSQSGDSLLLTGKPVNQIVSKEEKEQAEKSERWFKKVAELHDEPDLASAISDDDFPEIMPMRKGENRFVVSKKKDRSLTSPLYKRRMAMEQTNNTNFVPFVPFPPDYFAKKDKGQESSETPMTTDATSSTSVIQGRPEKSKEPNAGTPNYGAGYNSTELSDHQPASRSSWNTPLPTKNSSENKSESVQDGSTRNSTQKPGEDWISPSWKKSNNRSDAAPSPIPRSSIQDQPAGTQNSGTSSDRGFSGRSLEGSLVTEPDPLDMSEEAKAERWFRRAAQIKDISELSQIPDEDFPSIMPMRKGVNRFVVSKRKTPLERRLTSPQYRRNLPIVSSEPLKKEENDTR